MLHRKLAENNEMQTEKRRPSGEFAGVSHGFQGNESLQERQEGEHGTVRLKRESITHSPHVLNFLRGMVF